MKIGKGLMVLIGMIPILIPVGTVMIVRDICEQKHEAVATPEMAGCGLHLPMKGDRKKLLLDPPSGVGTHVLELEHGRLFCLVRAHGSGMSFVPGP